MLGSLMWLLMIHWWKSSPWYLSPRLQNKNFFRPCKSFVWFVKCTCFKINGQYFLSFLFYFSLFYLYFLIYPWSLCLFSQLPILHRLSLHHLPLSLYHCHKWHSTTVKAISSPSLRKVLFTYSTTSSCLAKSNFMSIYTKIV